MIVVRILSAFRASCLSKVKFEAEKQCARSIFSPLAPALAVSA